MAGLINDILMISRLEAKDAEVVVSDVRVSVLLEEIIDSLNLQQQLDRYLYTVTASLLASRLIRSR